MPNRRMGTRNGVEHSLGNDGRAGGTGFVDQQRMKTVNNFLIGLRMFNGFQQVQLFGNEFRLDQPWRNQHDFDPEFQYLAPHSIGYRFNSMLGSRVPTETRG